ncbi:MAG: hypothetical protein J4428_01150 [Candidatus Aenigmarchaeota archaeon]|nr:hypothetical protein [Candidatus Aenigmarchaeota archaeon]
MGTNIVTKFRLNTDDFKVFFDNEKKTHVAENLETGEKTNIGVLGIFLQMGILQPEEEAEKYSLVQRLGFLEDTVNSLAKEINQLRLEPTKQMKEDEEVKEESEEKSIKKKKLKFDVKEKIMERALEGMNDKENNVEEESEQEIENWGDI